MSSPPSVSPPPINPYLTLSLPQHMQRRPISALSGKSLIDLVNHLGVSYLHRDLPQSESELRKACFFKACELVKNRQWDALKPVHATLRKLDLLGRTLLTEFVERKDKGAVQRLFDIGAVGENIQQEFFEAVLSGDTQMVELILDSGRCNVNEAGTHYGTAIHAAVGINSRDTLSVLMKKGGNPNTLASVDLGPDHKLELTPLGLAVVFQHEDCIDELLKNAITSLVLPSVGTVAHLAARFDSYKALQHLLGYPQTKKILDIKDVEGRTPLSVACYTGSVNVVRTLCELPSRIGTLTITKADPLGQTPMHWAVLGVQKDIVQLLAFYEPALLNLSSKDDLDPLGLAEEIASDLFPDTQEIVSLLKSLRIVAKRAELALPDFQETSIENLVFQGLSSGSNSACIRAYEALKETGRTHNLQRLAGSSMGALLAAGISIGLPKEEIEALAQKDITSFQTLTPEGKDFLSKLSSPDIEKLINLFESEIIQIQKCLFTNRPIRNWHQENTGFVSLEDEQEPSAPQLWQSGLCRAERFERYMEDSFRMKTGISDCTFAELGDLVAQRPGYYKHLAVQVLNINEQGEARVVCLNSASLGESSPWRDVVISSALAAAVSIPLVFEPYILRIKISGSIISDSSLGRFLDGSMGSTIVETFDDRRFQPQLVGTETEEESTSYVLNRHTLELKLSGIKEKSASERQVDTPEDIVRTLVKLYAALQQILNSKPYNRFRTLEIREIRRAEVEMLNFDLPEETKQRLKESGEKATRDFFGAKKRALITAPYNGQKLEESAQKAFSLPAKRAYQVERPGLIAAIEEGFTDNHIVVLHGITGAGKTWLASDFGRKQAQAKGKEVYWIAAGVEGIVPSYEKLAKKLGLITEEDLKSSRGQEQAVKRVMEYFSRRSDCLLILDDVTSEEELSFEGIPLIPEASAQMHPVQVLITSQSDLFSGRQLVQVGTLTEQEVIELLRNTIRKPVSEALAKELSERLFYHPLLVNMTGCYIRQMSLRQRTAPLEAIIKGEIEGLKESSDHLPKGRKDKTIKEVENCWTLNLERAKEEDTHVEETLGICAYFAPTGMPVGWFEGNLRESFGILEAFGFCQPEEEERVNMHALVQLMSRRRDKGTKGHLKAAVELVNKKWASKEEDFEVPKKLEVDLPHILKVVQYASESGEKSPALANLLHKLGRYWETKSSFTDAEERFTKSLEMLRFLYGEEPHPDMSRVLCSLGNTCDQMGSYGRAFTHYKKSLEICRSLYGSHSHPDIVRTLRGLGNVYTAMGDYEEAQRHYMDCLSMSRRSYPKQPDSDEAKILNNLGSVYRALGDHTKMIESYQRSLAILYSLYGDGPHSETLALLNNLGAAYSQMGSYDQAKMYFGKSLEMQRFLYGSAAHPNVAQVLVNLGAVASGQGEIGLAKERLKQALEMMQALYGQKAPHPDVALVLMNLGEVARQQGELGLAKKHSEQALGMMQALYGQGTPHPNVAQVLMNLGLVTLGQEEPELAKERFEQALGMMQALYGQGTPHPHVAGVLMNLGLVTLGQEEPELAKERFEQALEMMQALYGQKAPHPDVALVLMNLGLVASKQGELELAKERLEQALEMMQALYGQKAPHPDVAQVLINLGLVAEESGRLNQAQEHLIKALNMMHKLYGKGTAHSEIARVLMNLGAVHRKQGNLELAQEYLTQELSMRREIHGEVHPYVAQVLINLGLLALLMRRNLVSAEDHLKEALSMGENSYGNDSYPTAGVAKQALSMIQLLLSKTIKLFKDGKKHYVKGEHTAAQALLKQALTKFKEAGDAKRGGACSIFYGATLRYLGDPAAEKFLEEGIAKVKAYTDQASQIHLSVGLLELGVLCIAQGKKGYAQFYLKKAVAIFDKTGATKGFIAQKKCLALSHLALISYEQKNLEEAIAHFNRATSIYDKVEEEGTPNTEIDALLVAFGEKMGDLASQALEADDQDSTTISKLQRSLSSAAPSDQREAAITGAYMLAKRGEWERLDPIADDLNRLANNCGKTLLMVAVSEGDKATARGLVERGISAFSKTAQGASALHIAAEQGDSQMMSIVRDTAGSVDRVDAFMRTPLHIAVYHNNIEAVRYLVQDLAAKLDSPAPYASGLWDEEPTTTEAALMASPVTLAVLLGHTDCFDTMMQRIDVRTELTSGDIGNLCHVAVHFRQTAMLEHLLKNYSELAQRYLKGEDAKGLTPAGVAAATGDIDSLEVIYRYAPKTILAKDRCGRTPVHWAAEGLHTEVLEFYGKHIPPQIACFEELNTPIRSNAAKSPIAILQDFLEKSPHDLKVQQAASAARRIMRQHKLGKLQSAEVLSKSSNVFLPTKEPTRTFAVPSKKQYEVERTGLLDQIEEAFTDNHLVVLHGITGTGKTHLASAFGRKQAGKEVYWINASTEDLVPAYVRLAKKLRLITEEELKTPEGQKQAIDRVMKYFSERSDCLLILDDVISEEELFFEGISLIPEGGAQVLLTRVLITSQSDLFSEGQLLQVEKLTEQEALELFTKTIRKPVPEELLSELSERLSYHPLPINMTGCYIRQMSLRQRTKPLETIITEEIDRLKESSTHMPQGRKDAIVKEVEKRWALNLARAKEENEHVEETLGICAYFAPTGIPVEWFKGDLRESFGVLEAFGFCHFEEEERVNMDGLVQRLSRRKDNEHLALQAAADIVEKKWGYAEEKFNIAEEMKQNVAHVKQVLEHLIKAEVHTEQTARLLMVLGTFQQAGAFFKGSQKAWEERRILMWPRS